MNAVEHEAIHPVFLTCAGTAEEVRHQLRRVKGDQVVAVVLNRSSEREAKVPSEKYASFHASMARIVTPTAVAGRSDRTSA